MTILRKALAIVGLLALLVGSALAGLYGIALAINRHDRPPSTAALEFASAAQSLPDVADRDNGYVYALGLAAPQGADPLRVGIARATEIRRLARDPALGIDLLSDAPAGGRDAVLEAERRLESVWRACDEEGNRGCFEALQSARDAIAATLGESSWALARYRALLDYPEWLEVDTYDWRRPLSPFLDIRKLQALLFLEAWTLADRGDAEGVRDLLDADAAFWRRTLVDSDLVINKVLIASSLRRHFLWANVILKRLPPNAADQGIPAAWQTPLSNEERSFRRVAVGEWRYARNVMLSLKTGSASRALPADIPDPRSAVDKRLAELAQPFLQPQDFTNRKSEGLARFAAAVDAPYAELPAGFARLAKDPGDDGSRGLRDVIYDFWGDALVGDPSDLSDYAARVADLEGIRRAVLLVSELRAAAVSPTDVPTALAAAELTNPYTGEPLTWVADTQEVVFIGQARGFRRRVALRY